jgi:mRNA-degrading endonuclease RelE of RelBE toxin-antitoxin system
VAFEELEADPFRPRPRCDIRMIQGHPDIRAVRIGEYRGIYEVAGQEVRFTTFGHRRNVYGG